MGPDWCQHPQLASIHMGGEFTLLSAARGPGEISRLCFVFATGAGP